jgi:hypothetical protein
MNLRRPKKLMVGFVVTVASILAAAQTDSDAQPLAIETTSLPAAYVKQQYQFRLEAQGGTPPLQWEITAGTLPAGVVLQGSGALTGVPTEAGEFQFTVTVTDSARPAFERSQRLLLRVVSPLMARWGRYPKVNGQRLEGSIWVSNQTDRDFDLTVIVLAVNEIGRATAIGYQHFPLKKNSDEIEIPFGDNLSFGSYELNVDAVAEVAATNSIYRARLVPKEKFQIQQGP